MWLQWAKWRKAHRTRGSGRARVHGRYVLSAGMTLPESWLAPTRLTLSRATIEMTGMATRITLQADGNVMALSSNSSYLPCLERGETAKLSSLLPTKKRMRCGKHRPACTHKTTLTHTAATRHRLGCTPRTGLPST